MDHAAFDIDIVQMRPMPDRAFAPLAANLSHRFDEDHAPMINRSPRLQQRKTNGSCVRLHRAQFGCILIYMQIDLKALGIRIGHAGRSLGARLIDLLYPSDCALCGTLLQGRRALCEACAADLPRIVEPFCQTCGMAYEGIIDHAFECPNCSGLPHAFEFARPMMLKDQRTLELIHQLKYQRSLHLAHDLGKLAADAFKYDPRLANALEEKWPLIPVPLHRSRLIHRHFNQAEEIALSISRHTGMPVISALRRTRDTGTQTRLTRKQRMKNLQGSFEISKAGKNLIEKKPQGAVLIDDVLTTGSTVNECAKTLRREGLHTVLVVTVMRG